MDAVEAVDEGGDERFVSFILSKVYTMRRNRYPMIILWFFYTFGLVYPS